MATSPGELRPSELSAVGADTTDPLLRALEVAIHVEEVLGIVLADASLDDAHLGTPAAVATTVSVTLGEH